MHTRTPRLPVSFVSSFKSVFFIYFHPFSWYSSPVFMELYPYVYFLLYPSSFCDNSSPFSLTTIPLDLMYLHIFLPIQFHVRIPSSLLYHLLYLSLFTYHFILLTTSLLYCLCSPTSFVQLHIHTFLFLFTSITLATPLSRLSLAPSSSPQRRLQMKVSWWQADKAEVGLLSRAGRKTKITRLPRGVCGGEKGHTHTEKKVRSYKQTKKKKVEARGVKTRWGAWEVKGS